MTNGSGRADVDADVIVDFDHHSDEFNLNELAVNAELRRRCPVAWNENYGGFWFVTRNRRSPNCGKAPPSPDITNHGSGR